MSAVSSFFRRSLSREPSRSRFGRLLPVWAALCAFACAGCHDSLVRERGRYPDGTLAYERSYVVAAGGKTAHGLQGTWYPDGTRKTLDSFVRGVRQGYAFRWDARGRLVRLLRCDEGRCRERPLPEAAPRDEAQLASSAAP